MSLHTALFDGDVLGVTRLENGAPVARGEYHRYALAPEEAMWQGWK